MTKEDTEKGENLVDGEEEQPKSRKTLYIGIGIAAGLVIIGVIIGVLIYVLKKKNDDNNNPDDKKFQVIKPKIDNAQYKLVNVENNGEKLEVLLISDFDIDKSGASISVHTGSLTDFINYDGLAHLTEHGIFGAVYDDHGNILYEQNYLLTYCGQNGGTINAMTSEEATSYLFEINNGAPYDNALDILATLVFKQQFIDEQVFEEAFNVNSEYINSFILDEEKKDQLIKSLSRKDGPYSQLTVGNLETLRNAKTKEEFKKTVFRYYSSYYVTKNFKLVLRAPLTLDQLEKKAKTFFSKKPAVPISQIDNSKNDDYFSNIYTNINSFPKENLKRFVWWKPNSVTPVANFVFYIGQNYTKTDNVNAHALVQYHVNSEHPNSLAEKLKAAKYATDIDCQIDNEYTDFNLLEISVTLTEDGLKNIKTVANHIINYLNKIKSTDFKDAIEEIKDNYQKTFDFTEKDSDIFNDIDANTRAMHRIEKDGILYRPYSFTKHTTEAQKAFLDLLTLDNLIILIGSKDRSSINQLFDEVQYPEITEVFYKTPYIYNQISDKDAEEINKSNDLNFSLRAKSAYHSNNKDLTSCGTKEQCKSQRDNKDLKDGVVNDKVVFKYNKDQSFRTPKVAGNLEIVFNYNSEDNDENNNNIIATNIFFNYLQSNSKIQTLVTELTDAGNTLNLTLNPKSFLLSFNIYSDVVSASINQFLQLFVDIKDTVITEDIFNSLNSAVHNSFLDSEIEMPRVKVLKIASRILTGHKLPSEINKININLTKYNELLNALKGTFKYKLIYVGDVTEDSVKKTADKLNQLVPPSPKPSPSPTPAPASLKFLTTDDSNTAVKAETTPKLTACYNFLINNTIENEINNAITNLYLVPHGANEAETLKNRKIAKIMLLAFGGTYFDQLRSVQKLGYYVRSLNHEVGGEQYINLSLMGPYNDIKKSTPETFEKAIGEVTDKNIKKIITDLTQAQVNEYVNAYNQNLKSAPYYLLSDKANDLFDDLSFSNTSSKMQTANLKEDEIKVEDLQNLFNKMFYTETKRLSIQLFYTSASIDTGVKTADYVVGSTKTDIKVNFKYLNDENPYDFLLKTPAQ